MRFTHSSSPRRILSALIGGLFAVLMTLVFVAPANASEGLGHPLYQISPTTFPYSTIVEITIPGYNDYTGRPLGRCTGWVYAPNMVATAGHCVYDKTAVKNGYYDTKGIRVWPAANGSTPIAQSCGVVKSFVPANWMAGQSGPDPAVPGSKGVGGNEAFDYGAFKLDCSIGGPLLKYGLQPTVTDFTRICGYPKNRALDTQWCSDDQVRAFDAYQVFYSNDTCGRMSGAPVMVWKNSEWNVTAIHTMPEHGTAFNHYTYNHGTRITPTVSNDLLTWQNDTSAGIPPNPPAQPQPIDVAPTCD